MRYRWSSAMIGLLLAAPIGCATTVSNSYERTSYYLDVLRSGVAAYQDSTSHLPSSLADTCPSLDGARCRWLPFGYRFTDAWGQLFDYAVHGDEFELRSGGPDRRLGTADDIVFRPSVEQRLVHRAAGCYRTVLPWWPELGEIKLELDTTKSSRSTFVARPNMPGRFRASWRPIGIDSIAVEWTEIHHSRQLRVFVADEALIGYSAVGTGAASWWGTRHRPQAIGARRVPCAEPSA